MNKFLPCLVGLLLLSWFAPAYSADGPLFNIPLSDLPSNQEVLVLSIDVAPGQKSQPHRHNGHVMVYMLSGKMNMQVAGGPVVQLEPGDVFYESPTDIHAVSDNASDTEPAKFLVYIIKTAGMPVSTPAN